MKRRVLAPLLAVLMLMGGAPAMATPVEAPPSPVWGLYTGAPPDVTASSWILFDDTYGKVLADHNADTPRPMASTTKIMTALLALERGNLDDPVLISQSAADVGEAEIGLEAGEVWTLRQLLTAMLVRSANDAAEAVAEYIGGTQAHFVELMNQRARELGLRQTSFANPHGLDAPGHFTTARELLELTLVAMQNPVFAELVHTRTAVLPPAPDGTERVAQTTNELLGSYPGAFGVKTGFTNLAGLVLVAGAQRDGRRLYTVVMGSKDHFGDAAALLDYGFDQYEVVRAVSAGAVYVTRMATEEPTSVAIAAAPTGNVSTTQNRTSPKPPSMSDALLWMKRYWTWLTGNG